MESGVVPAARPQHPSLSDNSYFTGSERVGADLLGVPRWRGWRRKSVGGTAGPAALGTRAAGAAGPGRAHTMLGLARLPKAPGRAPRQGRLRFRSRAPGSSRQPRPSRGARTPTPDWPGAARTLPPRARPHRWTLAGRGPSGGVVGPRAHRRGPSGGFRVGGPGRAPGPRRDQPEPARPPRAGSACASPESSRGPPRVEYL